MEQKDIKTITADSQAEEEADETTIIVYKRAVEQNNITTITANSQAEEEAYETTITAD